MHLVQFVRRIGVRDVGLNQLTRKRSLELKSATGDPISFLGHRVVQFTNNNNQNLQMTYTVATAAHPPVSHAALTQQGITVIFSPTESYTCRAKFSDHRVLFFDWIVNRMGVGFVYVQYSRLRAQK